MIYSCLKNTFLFLAIGLISCGSRTADKAQFPSKNKRETEKSVEGITVGANRTEAYLPLLKGKNVGIVANQTSVIFKDNRKGTEEKYTHLVDSLLSLNVKVTKVFSPEHGFRGNAAAGEIVKDGIDSKTGLPIVSLYGKNKKPTAEQLKNLDMVVFDIQDVGVRFYTYISTLHYVMEACAEQGVPLLVLDRPNPNGNYIDGPILEMKHQSFVGMHPVPVVHGMTMGEYANMINGENWLKNGLKADLTIIKMKHYNHNMNYSLPIKPSPNLPNDRAINLYPSLCFFEGTNVSAGRGTDFQFQLFGSPYLNSEKYPFSFVPRPNAGSKYPKQEGKICYGENLTNFPKLSGINLEWLITAYENTEDQSEFFTEFFTKLAGTTQLQKKIEAGFTGQEIRESWQEGLEKFREMRKKYLLYP